MRREECQTGAEPYLVKAGEQLEESTRVLSVGNANDTEDLVACTTLATFQLQLALNQLLRATEVINRGLETLIDQLITEGEDE